MAIKSEGHFIVKLTISKLADASTKTIWISNRTFHADELYSGSPDVKGILAGINGLGQEMGEVIPNNRTGTIQIKAVRGTYDFARRLYDFLEEYAFINQDIVVYSFKKAPNAVGSSSDLTVEFTGKVYDYGIDVAGGIFSLEVTSAGLSLLLANQRVTLQEDVADTTYYFSEAANSYLPIVIGAANEIEAVAYSESVTTFSGYQYNLSTRYVLGSTWGDTRFGAYFGMDGLDDNPVYIRDEDGIYQQAKLDYHASTNIPVFSDDGSNTSFLDFLTGARLRWAIPLDLSAYENHILTKINVRARGQNNGALTVEGDIIFKLAYGRLINSSLTLDYIDGAVATLPKLNIQGLIRGASAYETGGVSFEKPVYINRPDEVYLVIEETGLTSPNDQFQLYMQSGSMVSYTQDADDNNDIWNSGSSYGNPSLIEFYGYYRSFTGTIEEAGLVQNIGYNYGTGTVLSYEPSAREADLVFTVDGIIDDDPAVITDTAELLLTKSFDVVKLFMYLGDLGSLSRWDETRYPAARDLSLDVAGVITDGITFRDLIVEVLENSNSKLIPNFDGTYSFWTYGVTEETAAVFSEADCILESIDTVGIEEIVNKINLAYDPRIVGAGSRSTKQDNFGGLIEDEDTESIAIYGERTTAEEFLTPRLIRSAVTAQAYIDYKFIQYSKERQIYTIRVPFWKNNYRSVKMWSIVQLSHIDNPSKQGSTPPNITRMIDEDTVSEGEDWALGFVLRNAKRYFFRVVGRQPVYDLDGEPEIEFSLKILNNPNEVY